MAILIVLILCGAAAGFLLYCLFHFASYTKRRPQRRSLEVSRGESPRANIVPPQRVGPTSIAVLSRGTWDRFLTFVDCAESLDVRGEGGPKEHHDTTA